jgi:hypothetical protein
MSRSRGVNSFLYEVGRSVGHECKAATEMKERLALALIAGLLAAPVLAFGNGFSIYSDATLTNCTLSDDANGTSTVYVVHDSNAGATGVRFRIAGSAGFTGVWLSESTPYFKVGNSQTDISIGFSCLFGSFPVLMVTYQLFGTSTCSTLEIAGPQGFTVPICQQCQFDEHPCLNSHVLHVNCDGSIDCNPTATESTTWGGVKALYRD